MKKVIQKTVSMLVLAIATYFAYFSNNNGLSNIGISILYLSAIIFIIAFFAVEKKEVPNQIRFSQWAIVFFNIPIAIIAIYFGDFTMGVLFIFKTFSAKYLVKNL